MSRTKQSDPWDTTIVAGCKVRAVVPIYGITYAAPVDHTIGVVLGGADYTRIKDSVEVCTDPHHGPHCDHWVSRWVVSIHLSCVERVA